VAELKPRVVALLPHAPGHGQTPSRRAWGLPVTLALIDAANSVGCDDVALAAVFGELNSALGFDWLGDQLMALPAASLWQAMERDALVDELVTQHAQLAAFALSNGCEGPPSEAVARFLTREAKAIGGWKRALENARRSGGQDFALFSMTLRKLGDVTRALGAGR
jgi:NAD-specific glutamate dehydrogenase